MQVSASVIVPLTMREGYSAKPVYESERPVFTGTIGFDFVFERQPDGSKKPYCVEFNGHNSGIEGAVAVEKDPLRRSIIQLRAMSSTREAERMIEAARQVFAPYIRRAGGARQKELEKEKNRLIDDILLRVPHPQLAFSNPDVIEEISRRKNMHRALIPADYIPRSYELEGSNQPPQSGYWICKPISGSCGEHIEIHHWTRIYKDFIEPKGSLIDAWDISEFIVPAGADAASKSFSRRPASLRLLIDFAYYKDRTIRPVFVAAYQRVARSGAPRLGRSWKPNHALDAYIVNRSRGAVSVSASKDEVEACMPIALQTIQNLAKMVRPRSESVDQWIIRLEPKDQPFGQS